MVNVSPKAPNMRKVSLTLIIGIAMALFTLAKYYFNTSTNEITGEDQHISLTPEEEIALGLQSRAQMAQEYGGLDPSEPDQALVDQVGASLVQGSVANQDPLTSTNSTCCVTQTP